MKTYLIIIVMAIAIIACTSTVPLTSQGLSREERKFYIVQNGWNMSDDIKTGFLEGNACIDMSEDHIFMLFGPATQQYTLFDENNGEKKEVWKYLEGIHMKQLISVMFNKDMKVMQINGIAADSCSKSQ